MYSMNTITSSIRFREIPLEEQTLVFALCASRPDGKYIPLCTNDIKMSLRIIMWYFCTPKFSQRVCRVGGTSHPVAQITPSSPTG